MYGGQLLALHVETWNAQRNFVGKTLSNFAYEMGNEIKRQILPGAFQVSVRRNWFKNASGFLM
jgi:hypothetical protein